jgi:hypothetical protein
VNDFWRPTRPHKRKPLRPLHRRKPIVVPLPRNTEPEPPQDVRAALSWIIPKRWLGST